MSTEFFMITAAQVKAARALLGWRQADLAAASGVPLDTLKHAELKGFEKCNVQTVTKLTRALEAAGVIFTSTGGVDRKAKAGE
jgi:hypothetical protein